MNTVLIRSAFIFPFCAALLLGPLWPAPAAALDVTGPVSDNVYGDGGTTTPPGADPIIDRDHSLTVKSGGIVNGAAHGGGYSSNQYSTIVLDNTLTIESGGEVDASPSAGIYGGYASSGNVGNPGTGSATASGNRVSIAGRASADIWGALAVSQKGDATVQNNHITVEDGAVIEGTLPPDPPKRRKPVLAWPLATA